MRRLAGVFIGGGLLAAALADAAMRYPPEQIRAGQPFIYLLYVDVFNRLPLLVVWVLILGGVIVFKRARGGRISAMGWGLASVAVVIFSLVTPMIALFNGSNVVHVTSLSTETITFALYAEPTLRPDCDVVLVRCVGWGCRYTASYHEPICLSRRSPYRLTIEGESVVLWYGTDEVARLRP